ncbi:MAG: aminotransferase class V-fold PLP-dependent enzyme [Planctomycetota bacterium]|nr:aminotransferase class V-fold PLP-dependent enzyme [Planctomycetota bacterium]
MPPIYLDNNATTKPAPEVVEVMNAALQELWANPSSLHRFGQSVRQKMELARESVCRLLGCSERELIFTSGGTEGANLAILGSMGTKSAKNVVVTSRLEHSAVRELAERLESRNVEIVWLPSRVGGVIDVDALRELLEKRGPEIAVVSVQWANNETGVIQPVEAMGALCREHRVRFHTDGTQMVGKMPINVSQLPIDLLSFSAHKFHGPKGVGGLFVRRGVRLNPQTIGGPQERERRGGTENVPGILGLGAASLVAMQWLETEGRNKIGAMRDAFEQSILEQCEESSINSIDAPRLWNTTNIAFHRLEAEAILLLLSERGVCASAGAACSSGSLDPSPVLLAMGIPEAAAHGSIRFSLSRESTPVELDEAIEIVLTVIAKLRVSMSAV